MRGVILNDYSCLVPLAVLFWNFRNEVSPFGNVTHWIPVDPGLSDLGTNVFSIAFVNSKCLDHSVVGVT
jgi:hypothetical protein